jgi:hypothetical protein
MTDDELLAAIHECDGYEMHTDDPDYTVAKALEAEGAIRIGAARGPDRKWVRLETKSDLASLKEQVHGAIGMACGSYQDREEWSVDTESVNRNEGEHRG